MLALNSAHRKKATRRIWWPLRFGSTVGTVFELFSRWEEGLDRFGTVFGCQVSIALPPCRSFAL
jgi:hypothetical protein